MLPGDWVCTSYANANVVAPSGGVAEVGPPAKAAAEPLGPPALVGRRGAISAVSGAVGPLLRGGAARAPKGASRRICRLHFTDFKTYV
jgi:hypothetical protein